MGTQNLPDDKQRLADIQNYINRMPSLSTTVTKVMDICNSPATSPNDLNRVISLDPVLVGKVLKLINSAYYALPNQVTSLTRAIVMLGLNTVKNLALSTAVLENLGGSESSKALSMDDFWTHSICVGVTAKALAALKGIPPMDREEYFVAGLLHDLGKIVLNNRFTEEYINVLELVKNNRKPLCEAEVAFFGIDHCSIGTMIAEKWRLNENLTNCLRYHHDPVGIKDEKKQLAATIVALANLYGNILGIGSSGDIFPDKSSLSSFAMQVGIELESIKGLDEKVKDEIEKAKVFLQICKKG
ncbi:MAG: HDOD domain-containing protein [Pseudomonadota bacterium]